MKVGILTASHTNNNGTDLQAYAMQNLFMNKTRDNEIDIINYRCKNLEKQNKIVLKFSVSELAHIPQRILNNLYHGAFQKKHLKTSSKRYDRNSVHELEKDYDVIIVGSDQVWNLNLIKNDLTFYLDFSSSLTKYSYAVSLGQDDLTNWESQISLSDLLNEFEYVSIRELNSISDLKKIGVKARYDLDPVLMVPAYIYKDIEKYPKVKRKYLLLYFVKINKNALNWAIDYAKKKNLDVVMISDSIKKIPSIKMISAISVESWMGYMRAAELVLTNSYHGISYCIATHTNFLYVDLNTNVQTNSRMMNLLQISGLENRIWNSSTNNFVDSIVWDEVERKLDKKRKDSEKYIYKILQGKEEKEI